MRKYTKTIMVLSFLASLASAQANSGEMYSVDSMHSKVSFEVPHLVISSVAGDFTDFSGVINLNDTDFKKSKVSAQVQVSSIDTGVAKRDEHLKSEDFFAVSKYPIMKLESRKITGQKSNFKLETDLTIKGIKKRVTFDGQYLGTVKDGYGNLKAVIKAEATINRQDFGLTWNSMVEAGPVVGDEVTIKLNIQAARPIKKLASKN